MALLHLLSGINDKSYQDDLEELAQALLGIPLSEVISLELPILLSRLSVEKGEIALLLREAFEESQRIRLGLKPKVGPN